MYTATLLASAALMAGSALAAPGNAVVVNACTYPVYLAAVPAANGGHQETTKVLQPGGDSWTQQYTELTNGNGWSIKLSKKEDRSNPLQYEYTYHSNEDVIWYDLSCVDGNPWDKNWEVTASGNKNCLPKQSFYRFATDDAFGMQDCPHDSDITVTLCSGESQADGVVSAVLASSTPVAASTPSTTTTAAQQTYAQQTHAQQTTVEQTHKSAVTANPLAFDGAHFFNAADKQAAVPTTLATSVAPVVVAADNQGNVVTVVETVVETAVAYETYVPGKRHVHHPEHPHFR